MTDEEREDLDRRMQARDLDRRMAAKRAAREASNPAAATAKEALAYTAGELNRTQRIVREATDRARDVARGVLQSVPAVATTAGKLVANVLPGASPQMEAPTPLTETEKDVLYEGVIPTLGMAGAAVGGPMLGLGAGGAALLNLLAAPLSRTTGRTLRGKATGIADIGRDLTYGIPNATFAKMAGDPVWRRVLAALTAGGTSRNLRGESTTATDALLDTMGLGAYSSLAGGARGARIALTEPLNQTLPDYETARELRNSLRPYGPSIASEAAKVARLPRQTTETPERWLRGFLRGAFRQPISRAERSPVEFLRELAERAKFLAYSGGQRFGDALSRARQEVAGIVSGLEQRGYDPGMTAYLTDYDAKLVGPPRPKTTGPPAPLGSDVISEAFEAHADPFVVQQAEKLKQLWDAIGDVSEDAGLFTPNAPRLPGYGGPLIEQNTNAARQVAELGGTQTYEAAMGPQRGFRRRYDPYARKKTFDPTRHVTHPLQRLEYWIGKYRKPVTLAAAFGPPPSGSPKDSLVAAAKSLEKQRIAAQYSSDFGPAIAPPGVAEAADELTARAVKGGTTGSRALQDIANRYAQRADIGMQMSTEDIIAELQQMAAAQPEAPKLFGDIAARLLTRAREAATRDRDRATIKLFEDTFKRLYNTPGDLPDMQKALGQLSQAVSTGFLAKSGARQIGQGGWSIMRPGAGMTSEGIVRRFLDPSARQFIEETGAGASPMAAHLARMAPEEAESLVSKAIGGGEKINRTVTSAGHLPYMESLLARARSGERNRAILRELREAGITPPSAGESAALSRYDPTRIGVPEREAAYGLEDLATTAENVGQGYRHLTGRSQLMSTEPFFSSDVMIGDPVGRVAFQYSPYSVGTSTQLHTDVLDPIWSGLKHGFSKERDFSELGLGADRLARLVPAGLGLTALAEALVSGQSLQLDPDQYLGGLPRRTYESYTGLPGQFSLNAAEFGQSLLEGKGRARAGMKLALDPLVPPAFSLIKDPDPWTAGIGMLAALYSPKVAGALSMAAPAAKTVWNAATADAAAAEEPLERTPIQPEAPAYSLMGESPTRPTLGISTPGLSDELFEGLPDYLRRDPFE